MTANTQTFPIGRFRLSLSVDPSGRIRETWSPRPPVRLNPGELNMYHRVKAGYAAPVVIDAIPKGAKTRLNVNGKRVAVAEASR